MCHLLFANLPGYSHMMRFTCALKARVLCSPTYYKPDYGIPSQFTGSVNLLTKGF